MRRLKSILYYFLSFICLVGGIGSIFGYKYFVEPKIDRVEVVKVKETMQRGTKVTENNVEIQLVKRDEVVEGALTALSGALGKETRFFVKKGQQVIPEMIDDKELALKPGQFNAPIPVEWLLTIPGSLLRGDHIALYAVEDPKKEPSSSELLRAWNSEKILVDNQGNLKTESGKLKGVRVLDDVVVSYVKSNNNVEVTTADDKRKQPSGNVATVEVIVDQKTWDKIAEYPLKGYKLILMYR